jgi:hypothetical protein
MPFTAITNFSFDAANNNRVNEFIYTNGKKTITEFLDYIVRTMNNRL